MNDSQRLKYLFSRYISANSTPEENRELSTLVEQANEQDLSELLTATWQDIPPNQEIISPDDAAMILQRILKKEKEPSMVIHLDGNKKTKWWKYLTAAAILLLFAGGTYYLAFFDKKKEQPTQQVKAINDLSPGQNGAILTLANGEKIILDSAKNGVLATQGSMKVIHSNGQLQYQPGNKDNETVMLNTVTTPKGRQYQLLLSDGSKVWLNAASSITYPTGFGEKKREVTISGEVYFEVSADKKRPFIVTIEGKEKIEVLGTHFNINAYNDEPSINTTLLEGSIRITSTGNRESKVLKPGQQAQLNNILQIVSDVNIDEVMAWKNGYFSFNGATTEVIMRQVKRWYDAEVIYQGDVKNERFAGSVPRSENASKLLEVLELTKTLKFRIERKNIIVTPY